MRSVSGVGLVPKEQPVEIILGSIEGMEHDGTNELALQGKP